MKYCCACFLISFSASIAFADEPPPQRSQKQYYLGGGYGLPSFPFYVGYNLDTQWSAELEFDVVMHLANFQINEAVIFKARRFHSNNSYITLGFGAITRTSHQDKDTDDLQWKPTMVPYAEFSFGRETIWENGFMAGIQWLSVGLPLSMGSVPLVAMTLSGPTLRIGYAF